MSKYTDAKYPGVTFRIEAEQDGSIRSQENPSVTCPCGANVPLHLMHWVAEVCPRCLQNFRWGSGADYSLYLDSGWFDGATQPKIRANIARNGGRYVPEFSRG